MYPHIKQRSQRMSASLIFLNFKLTTCTLMKSISNFPILLRNRTTKHLGWYKLDTGLGLSFLYLSRKNSSSEFSGRMGRGVSQHPAVQCAVKQLHSNVTSTFSLLSMSHIHPHPNFLIILQIKLILYLLYFIFLSSQHESSFYSLDR